MSNLIDLPVDSEQVKSMAERVLKDIEKKIKEDIAERFYDEMSGYLYEHYENAGEKVQNELLDKLVSQYINDPEHYKFKKLRIAIFEENKDKILPSITQEAIREDVQTVLSEYTHKKYVFEWKTKEEIARFMCKNYELFAEDERFNNAYTHHIKQLNDKITFLETKDF